MWLKYFWKLLVEGKEIVRLRVENFGFRFYFILWFFSYVVFDEIIFYYLDIFYIYM